MVDHRKFHLRDNRQVVREEQVVIAMDAAADRVLNRQDAVGAGGGDDGVEDLFEAPARRELRVGIDASGRSLAEGARLALIRYLHGGVR